MTKKKLAAKPHPRPHPVCTGKARETLAANLAVWLETLDPRGVAKLSQKSGVSKKTIYNMKNAEYDPIGPTEAVAQAYGKEAWMLLCPSSMAEISHIIQVYNTTNDQGRVDIRNAIEIIDRRK